MRNNVANGFTTARLQAAILISTVKKIGQQKFSGMLNSLRTFKTTITEGKTGAAGFVTALKSIGKISVASTVNGVKKLVSGFKSSENGSNSLHGALKKVASVNFNALHSGLAKIGSTAKSAGSAVLSGLGKAATTTLKGTAVAIGAAATATAALVTQSVKAFANYEQLTGGVETLFKDSAGIVENYANNAYKTAGLSANAYMETVTGFSASLLQSLGGDTTKAADYAHLAITDMADNATVLSSRQRTRATST